MLLPWFFEQKNPEIEIIFPKKLKIRILVIVWEIL